jgi:hypothetical protein
MQKGGELNCKSHSGIVFSALPCVAVAAKDTSVGSVCKLSDNCLVERFPDGQLSG